MMPSKFHILMGDVISSSKRDPNELQQQLRAVISSANKQLSDQLLSPYTTTLGDEFQGVAKSLVASVRTLFVLEEEILRRGFSFKFHYVAHFGAIVTPINPEIAYEMMGPGLAEARALLVAKQRKRPRFTFEYGDPRISRMLNGLFMVVADVVDSWKSRDFPLVVDLLGNSNDSQVGTKWGKDRTLIWRRRNSLRTDEYLALKSSLLDVCAIIEEHSVASR